MKTAVSIPEDVFKRVEGLARRTKKSRSRLFSDALREYVARHAAEEVTEAMNRVSDEVGDSRDPFVSSAARYAQGILTKAADELNERAVQTGDEPVFASWF